MSKWKIGLIFGLVINMSLGDLAYHQKRFKLNHQEVSGLYSNITGQIKKFSEILEDPKSYTMPDQLFYSEELDFYLGVANTDIWGLQAAHDNLVSIAEIIESSRDFYEHFIEIPKDEDFTHSLSKYIKVIKLPGGGTSSGIDDFISDLDKAYNDYEDENYAKAGLDLVKVFIKTFTTVNAVKRSGPPPDYKSMGGALSINRQMNRLTVKVMEMNFLVQNLKKTILRYDSNEVSTEILTLPGVANIFENRTADEREELLRRSRVLRTYDRADQATEMHVMVPKELEKWHEKLLYWVKSNINEVVQYIWPLLVLFFKERVQEWIAGAIGYFQGPKPNMVRERQGMLGN